MSNQTTCPACHAVLRSETPLAVGTPIKCPSCQHIFRAGDVPVSPPGTPATTVAPGAVPPGPMPPPPRKRRALRIVLWILFGSALGLCLCCVGLGYFYQFQTADDSLLGTWELDIAETSKINPALTNDKTLDKTSISYEFNKGFPRKATLVQQGKTRQGIWAASRQGDREIIQFTEDGAVLPQQYEFERAADDPDHIKVTADPSSLPTPYVLKRVK